jgi:hypothetical protein
VDEIVERFLAAPTAMLHIGCVAELGEPEFWIP